ncbi:MAG: hypothetical protein AB7S78_13745 [Candidatus Omnitrophota bacterium]
MVIQSRKTCLLFMIAMVILFYSRDSSAGSLKTRIQQRLNETSNIQYEPYYLSTSNSPATVPPQEAGQTAQRALRKAEGFQQSQYDPSLAGKDYDKSLYPVPVPPGIIASYAIYNVNYVSALEDNVVTVKGNVLFEVFEDGRTQIPLVSSNVGLIDVTVNKGSSFVMNFNGKYYLIMHKKGKYTLEIEYLIKAQREREHGPGSFQVDVIPAPISQFEFDIAEKGVQIFIEPAIKVEQDVQADKTVAWAVMPNTSSISVRWTKALPKEKIETVELEPKVYAETATHSSVGGGIIHSQTYLNYSILQAEVSSFRVALPEDVSVLNVIGADMRDWKINAQEGVQYLDVFLNFGRKGDYGLTITYEKNITEGSGVAQMPWVRAMGVEREIGYYGVAASTNVELAVKNKDKTTQIDIKQLPASIWQSSANPILLAFKYLNHPVNIEIEVTRHEELPVLVAAIDRADHMTLHTNEGKILTKVTYQVRNNVKQFLRFKLPDEAVIWSSFVAGKPVKPAKDKDGNTLIPLEKSHFTGGDLTQFPVEIVYLDHGKKMNHIWGQLNLNLPSTDIPISQSYWSVYLPYDYTYYKFDGDMKEVKAYARGGYVMETASRTRSSADSIGDQFSAGNTSMYQAKAQQLAAPMEKGILPIKINVPQQGQHFQFSKLLVVDGESSKLKVKYTPLIAKVVKPVKMIMAIGLIFGLIVFVFRKVSRSLKKKKTPSQNQ